MIKNYLKIFISLIFLTILVSGCTATGKKKPKAFKHDTPLIKTDVKKLGKSEVDKTAEMGPIPVEADVVKLKKRKKIDAFLRVSSFCAKGLLLVLFTFESIS